MLSSLACARLRYPSSHPNPPSPLFCNPAQSRLRFLYYTATDDSDADRCLFVVMVQDAGCENKIGYVYMSENAKSASPTFTRVDTGGINLEVRCVHTAIRWHLGFCLCCC